jgi:hypothetical protein
VSIQYAGKAGAGISGTVQAVGGIAYTFEDPIWRYDISDTEAKGLRIGLALYKILLGVGHGNPIAVFRDSMGLIGGVEDVIGVELTDPIVNFLIPMPDAA